MTFIEECINGTAKTDDIDDYVDAWHEKDLGVSLRQYLGMNKEEYTAWMKDPQAIESIVQEHRKAKQ